MLNPNVFGPCGRFMQKKPAIMAGFGIDRKRIRTVVDSSFSLILSGLELTSTL